MAKKIKYSEVDNMIIRHIEDNILFYSFKEKVIDITLSIIPHNGDVELMEQHYLHSFQTIADELRNEKDAENNTEDAIFDMFMKVFNDNVDQHSFYEIMSMRINELAEKIFNEWNIGLKAIRSTYKPQKIEML